MIKGRASTSRTWCLLLALVGLPACGDDSDDDDEADAAVSDAAGTADAPPPDADDGAIDAAVVVDAAPIASIEAVIEYAGDAEGTLFLAAFTTNPPSGQPLGFAQGKGVFPQTLTLLDLPAGPAYAVAILDVAPASPTQPGPEDRTSWSDELSLELGQVTSVTITLTDPDPQ